MGVLESKPVPTYKKLVSNLKAIEDIYLMFEESNKIIIASARQKSTSPYQYTIKNIEQLLNQLLEPFLEQQKYPWGYEIFHKFKNHFIRNFQMIWNTNRQQFYQLLLINCHVVVERGRTNKSFQKYFYEVSVNKIEEKIPNSYIDNFMKEEKNINLMNHSILMNGMEDDPDMDLPLFIPTQNQQKIEVEMAEIINQTQSQAVISQQVQASRMRMQNCSLLLPQTVFVDRLSTNTQSQVSDLLKYYNQFVNTVNQLFYSNNLVSCPMKHFIFSIEQKILRKKIKNTHVVVQNNNNQEGRKIRKIRQQNNNIILFEVKAFLQAYTSFVWMYLELHQMAQSRLGKIINSDILYGIIFKSVWNFVDWISQRGYEYEQSNLQEYYKRQQLKNEAKLQKSAVEYLLKIAQGLRKQKHPQQYLKKVVILYREVSKHCQNADELLMIYEYILGLAIKERGSKDLYIFRMRNIIQKLLKIDDNSMSGGEISYSWTTWCILIQLLRQKTNYQYGNVIISKDSFNQSSSFTIEQSIVKNDP